MALVQRSVPIRNGLAATDVLRHAVICVGGGHRMLSRTKAGGPEPGSPCTPKFAKPRPSCPAALFPQHQVRHALSSAQRKLPPGFPATRRGEKGSEIHRGLLEPPSAATPASPDELPPQHTNRSWSVVAQEPLTLSDSSTTPLTGIDAGAPTADTRAPARPSGLSPQHHGIPWTVAHAWTAPSASISAGRGSGTRRGSRPPAASPSCPKAFEPQQ
jgi:hypothetical protein